MRTRIMAFLCAGILTVAGTSRSVASTSTYSDSGTAMIADVVIARPLCFAATIIGAAFFVVSLPFAAASDSVDRAAHALVVEPARATFTRPLGDFDELSDP